MDKKNKSETNLVPSIKVGWREWVKLPKLGLNAIHAKIDTGAKTSALHAIDIETFGPIERPKVRFGVKPIDGNENLVIYCTAPIIDRRYITSSNGESEFRTIIRTDLAIDDENWPIEVSLTNRENLIHRMLIGREAMDAAQLVVEPSEDYLLEKLSFDIYKNVKTQSPVARALRIGLLTMEPNNYSNQQIIAAAEKNDHVIEPIETTSCYMNINSLTAGLHYNGKQLPRFDAIIPRIGAPITAYGTSIVRQFDMTGALCLNSADSIYRSRDKLLAHQVMARHGLPMPITAFASSPKNTEDLIKLVNGAPLVVKLLKSSQGKGVVLAETKKAAESVIDAFRGIDADFLVQEFIGESDGSDIRCLVLGNKVIATMRRTAEPGEFRANIHQGGSAEKVKITKEERQMAVKAAKAFGLSLAGVDILRSNKGPLLLEVNSSPGLKGIQQVNEKDLAQEIITYIENKLFKPKTISAKLLAKT
ncbi:MAG: 30S ribosomal protein S6--L-glutamate ligase [Rhizobiales bacterium]|nr:30S ribosomal protein S6--L-glutamate ligase [Hyphomicrobiales bacterium]